MVAKGARGRVLAIGNAGNPPADYPQRAAQHVGGFAWREEYGAGCGEFETQRKEFKGHGWRYSTAEWIPGKDMTGLDTLIRNHIDYTIWATNRQLEAAVSLSSSERQRDFGSADRSIEGTFTHLLRAERTWLLRIQEGTPSVPWALAADEQWDILISEWPILHERWRDWGRGLSASDAEAVLTYADLQGNIWKQPIWQIVLHVINHSTHHRGQIAAFLRASGRTPPPLDFIAFMRLQIPGTF